MKKTAIFEDVVSIMTHDSSTDKDRKGCDPEPFRENITDDRQMMPFSIKLSYLARFWGDRACFEIKRPKGFL